MMSLTLAFASLLLGCASDNAISDYAPEATEDAQSETSLRVDVQPPADSGLLAQSLVLHAQDYQKPVSITLAPTVTFEGNLTGLSVHGWSADVPSTPEPIDAVMAAVLPGTAAGASARVTADENGAFSLMVPASRGYVFSIVPDDASACPISVQLENFNADRQQDIELPIGIPVYGQLSDGAGQPLAYAPLRLVNTDNDTAISSSTFYTDSRGWYTTRVAEFGTWQLETLPGPVVESDYLLPALSAPVLIENEAGVEVDLAAGNLTKSGIIGKVIDQDGDSVVDAQVRIISSSLQGSEGSYHAETLTAPDGNFYIEALSGTYQLEIIPPYSRLDGPMVQEVHVGPSVETLGNLSLPAPSSLSGVVIGNAGSVANVLVTAKQTGFAGYSWSATTNAEGHYSIDVPVGDYEMSFSPTDGQHAIEITGQSAGTAKDVTLREGVLVSGSLLFDEETVGFAMVELRDIYDNVVGRTLSDSEGNFSVRVNLPDAPDMTGSTIDSGDTGN